MLLLYHIVCMKWKTPRHCVVSASTCSPAHPRETTVLCICIYCMCVWPQKLFHKHYSHEVDMIICDGQPYCLPPPPFLLLQVHHPSLSLPLHHFSHFSHSSPSILFMYFPMCPSSCRHQFMVHQAEAVPVPSPL